MRGPAVPLEHGSPSAQAGRVGVAGFNSHGCFGDMAGVGEVSRKGLLLWGCVVGLSGLSRLPPSQGASGCWWFCAPLELTGFSPPCCCVRFYCGFLQSCLPRPGPLLPGPLVGGQPAACCWHGDGRLLGCPVVFVHSFGGCPVSFGGVFPCRVRGVAPPCSFCSFPGLFAPGLTSCVVACKTPPL